MRYPTTETVTGNSYFAQNLLYFTGQILTYFASESRLLCGLKPIKRLTYQQYLSLLLTALWFTIQQ